MCKYNCIFQAWVQLVYVRRAHGQNNWVRLDVRAYFREMSTGAVCSLAGYTYVRSTEFSASMCFSTCMYMCSYPHIGLRCFPLLVVRVTFRMAVIDSYIVNCTSPNTHSRTQMVFFFFEQNYLTKHDLLTGSQYIREAMLFFSWYLTLLPIYIVLIYPVIMIYPIWESFMHTLSVDTRQ